MLAVIVRFVVKQHYQQQFLDRVQQQASDTLAHEPDCRQFDICRDAANPGRVLLYEIYTDADAFARHLAAPYFLAFDRETRDWIETKEVEQWPRQER
jgi:quinol monooxygenase YgiN